MVRITDYDATMPTSTLTSKGQTTIPKKVREHLRVESGDRLDFIIERGGRVVLQAASADIIALDGMLDRSDRAPISTAAMDDAIGDAVSQPFRGEE